MSENDDPVSLKVALIVTRLIRIALIGAAVFALLSGRWAALFASIGTLALTFVPGAVASRARLRLPLQFEGAITLFLYAALLLGETGDYYERFWWWDVVLHTGSAFAFGFAGFLILYLLVIRGKLSASPFLIAWFSFAFGLAIGTLWEIFEYAMDVIFGLNMQKSGLQDTMADLIVDSIGAGVASFIGYLNLKYTFRDPFDAFIGWFLRENPHYRPKK